MSNTSLREMKWLGAALVALVTGLFGAASTEPLIADEVRTGTNTEVNGKYTCDCVLENNKCICIVKEDG